MKIFDSIDTTVAHYVEKEPEAYMACDHCGGVFVTFPPVMSMDEWIFRLEYTGKYCSTKCRDNAAEAAGLAEAARRLR